MNRSPVRRALVLLAALPLVATVATVAQPAAAQSTRIIVLPGASSAEGSPARADQ